MAILSVKGQVMKFGGQNYSFFKSLITFGGEWAIGLLHNDSRIIDFLAVKDEIPCFFIVLIIFFFVDLLGSFTPRDGIIFIKSRAKIVIGGKVSKSIEMDFFPLSKAVSNKTIKMFHGGRPRGNIVGPIDEDIANGFEFFLSSVGMSELEWIIEIIGELIFVSDLLFEMVAIVDGLFQNFTNVGIVPFKFLSSFAVVLVPVDEKNNHLRNFYLLYNLQNAKFNIIIIFYITMCQCPQPLQPPNSTIKNCRIILQVLAACMLGLGAFAIYLTLIIEMLYYLLFIYILFMSWTQFNWCTTMFFFLFSCLQFIIAVISLIGIILENKFFDHEYVGVSLYCLLTVIFYGAAIFLSHYAYKHFKNLGMDGLAGMVPGRVNADPNDYQRFQGQEEQPRQAQRQNDNPFQGQGVRIG